MSEGLPQDSAQTIRNLYKDLEEREAKLDRPIIDKNVLIPVGAVLGSLAMIIAVVWFFASLTFRVEAAEIRLDKLEEAIIGFNNMERDIAVIKSQVEGLTKMFSDSEIKIK